MNIVNKKALKIILGSYPGRVSDGKSEYYSNKSNKIWNLIGINSNLSFLEKVKELERKNIGMWDTESSCKRISKNGKDSSLDKDIKDEKFNNLEILLNKEIYFNGKKAFKDFKKAIKEQGLIFKDSQLHLLLSSSGANNGKKIDREIQWKEAFGGEN